MGLEHFAILLGPRNISLLIGPNIFERPPHPREGRSENISTELQGNAKPEMNSSVPSVVVPAGTLLSSALRIGLDLSDPVAGCSEQFCGNSALILFPKFFESDF